MVQKDKFRAENFFKKLLTLLSYELKYKLINTHIRKIEVEQK